MATIKFRRGVFASIPTLAVGEPGWASDTQDFYVGTGSGNIKFAKAAHTLGSHSDFSSYLDQAVKQASPVQFGKIKVDAGGSTAWRLLELRNNNGIMFRVEGDGKVYIGTYYVDALIANNQFPDSKKFNGKLYSECKLDDWAEPDDNIDLNASITRHGLLRKLNNKPADCLTGDGAWLTLYDSTSIVIKILSKASTNLRNSNDAEQLWGDPTYEKVKEMKMGEPTGVMRIYFDMKSSDGSTVYGRIYVKDVAVGAIESTNSQSYVTFHEDLGPFASQDLIQVYAKAGTEDVYIKNQQFKYDRTINMLGEHTLTAPIAIEWNVGDEFIMYNQDP